MKVTKGSVDPTWSAAEQVERARAATGPPVDERDAPTASCSGMARRFLTTNVKPGDDVAALPGRARPVGPAPPAALRPRRLPLLSDRMHCDDFSRTDAERRSRLEAPISRRRLLQAGLGATVSLYAARAMPLARAFEAAEAERAGGAQRAGAGQRLRPRRPGPARHAGPRGRLRPLRRPAPGAEGRPAVRSARQRLRRAPGAGGGARRRPQGPLRPRHGSASSPASTTPTPTSRTSTAGTSGRPASSRSARRRAGSRAGPIATAGPTTRSRRCRWTPACRRCCAAAATRSPPSQSPDDAQSWVPGVWGEWQDRMMEHYAAHRRPAPARRRRRRGLRRRAPEPARGAHAQALRQGPQDGRRPAGRRRSPIPAARTARARTASPRTCATSPALLTLPLGIRVATVDAPGDFDTHDDQAPTLVRDLAAALAGRSAPSRPTSRRAASPTAS